MVWIGISVVGAFLTALSQGYAKTPIAEGRPIEAYVQITKIIVYVAGGIVFVAVLMNQRPWPMLTGLGALMAVILLVFRDTILSFVASLQMASYDMVRVGDWIEMSQYGADGDVIELSLHTVKVQNWDKTITAIPTHKLIEQPFRNWRGMQESGGRRIKRAFFLDMKTIRFLTPAEIDRLENFLPLRDYIQAKREELETYNKEYASDSSLILNARRLTNVGTLRAYMVGYLKRHPKVHQDMTLIVRQLAPTPDGLPIELYLFANTTAWNDYEGIQSDIFDHVFSIVPEFGLRVFQAPAGTDFARLARSDG
jgi:miniconductance mechanosensitive channel